MSFLTIFQYYICVLLVVIYLLCSLPPTSLATEDMVQTHPTELAFVLHPPSLEQLDQCLHFMTIYNNLQEGLFLKLTVEVKTCFQT